MLAFARRNILEPLYCRKNGSPKISYWRELERTQFFSEDTLRQIQWERLKGLLEFVCRKNGFYRKRLEDAGLSPEQIRTPEDFRRIPILTKEEIRRNAADMISEGFDRSSLLQFKTGGSTGKPLEIYVTEECSERRNACARRHDRWAGWEPGEPVGAVWGNPKLPKTFKEKLRHQVLGPVIYLDTMAVNEGAVRAFAEEWERVRPTLMFGHAHSIFLLARYVRDLGIESIRPKGIITSSMMLVKPERDEIEEVFKIKVTNRYGCEEVSLIASECERHEGLHLNIEHLFIEFIREDGLPAGPGEEGRIIVTDLMNRAMPFIRYQVEDFGVPSERTCSCGRGMPLMERVVGRTADFLVRLDGTRVAGVSLIENTLTVYPGIEQMQLVQDRRDHLLLRIVTESDYSAEVEETLLAYFRKQFPGVRLTIRKEERIEQEQSGKFRFAICRV